MFIYFRDLSCILAFAFSQCGLYFTVISFVCKLGSAQVGQGHVEVTINDLYTAKSEYQFTYVVSFCPRQRGVISENKILCNFFTNHPAVCQFHVKPYVFSFFFLSDQKLQA